MKSITGDAYELASLADNSASAAIVDIVQQIDTRIAAT